MKRVHVYTVSLVCFGVGILAFALSREWIIIRWSQKQGIVPLQEQKTIKKTVALYFWQHNSWQHEKVELLWPEESTQRLTHLINKWLAVINEEQISKKRITLQSVMVTDNDYAYISFDRNPIVKSQSTYYNVMWFEGLLKTIRESDINLQGVYFMAHHQPIHDTHLEFSHPWPTNGFIRK